MAISPTPTASPALWPPDDTEESVVGIDLHQHDSTSLRTGLIEEAQRRAEGGYRPWEVDEQSRWASRELEVAIGVEDGLAVVSGRDGYRHPREGEVGAALRAERLDGEREGSWIAARRLARRRFGAVAALEARIDAADEAALEALLDRLLTATDPADLLP